MKQQGKLMPHLAEVRRMRQRGYALQRIADRFGVTRQAVHRALKRAER